MIEQLLDVYKQVKIGDPLENGTLLGPFHTKTSRDNFVKGIEAIRSSTSVLFFLNFVELTDNLVLTNSCLTDLCLVVRD